VIGRDRVAVEYLPKLLGLSSVERERERERERVARKVFINNLAEIFWLICCLDTRKILKELGEREIEKTKGPWKVKEF
jgi:hypothetical protein